MKNNSILLIIFLILLLLLALRYCKNNERFLSSEDRAKLLKGIKLNLGEIENLNELEIKEVPSSEKIVIKDIVKNYTVKKLIFNKNIQLTNYTNVVNENNIKVQDNTLELFYESNPVETIHNLFTSFAVGHEFSSNEKNPYYGVQIQYKPKELNSKNNRAEIGIEFKSYMDLHLGKLMDMVEILQDEDYKEIPREKVEVMAGGTKKFEYLPYFRDTGVEALVLFKHQQNEEFLKTLDGYFNIVDIYNNRILTKCKLDSPYCKAHIPQKGKIYGRDRYVAAKFFPKNDNFTVIAEEDVDLEQARTEKKRHLMSRENNMEKKKHLISRENNREKKKHLISRENNMEKKKHLISRENNSDYPLYIGCYANEGSNRNVNHISGTGRGNKSYISIEKCLELSSGLFGMEYPQEGNGETAQCLLLSEMPNLQKVDNNECEHELDSQGRRLGSAARLTIYSKNSSGQSGSSERIPCAANHGKTTACCGQRGDDVEQQYICPANKPVCRDYVLNQQWGYCDTVENFVGNFQDDSETPNEESKKSFFHKYYKKYLTKKDCLNEKDENERKISIKQYLEENEIDKIEPEDKTSKLTRLAGNKCIKHHNKFREDYFYGGFDKENIMFCYGKDEECILFPNKQECEGNSFNDFFNSPENNVKGLKSPSQREYYDEETLTTLKDTLEAEMEEENGSFKIKCQGGKYLEGTYNHNDELSVLGGIYKNCNDANHPLNEECDAPSASSTYHLSELITTKGNKVYNPSNSDKYSNFGDLAGKCIQNNIPDGKLIECDPLDDHMPCYVGDRDGPAPGESISNKDIYNNLLGYNCRTYTLPTNTCKHNNMSVLSDIITFSSPLEKNFKDILDEQKILKISDDVDMTMLTDEEKYEIQNLHFFIEKYFPRYENMNPANHFNLRYTIKFETFYDMITKQDDIILNIYYRGEKEASLTDNMGETYILKENDLIEVLVQKDNYVLFRIKNSASGLIEAQYTSTNKIEGKYGSPINFFVKQNNNTFLRNIKYKEEIPTTVLPYNPFINIKQL